MTFPAALDRIRRWRRYGRCLAALIGAAALGCVLVLSAGLADAQFAFEIPDRTRLVTVALIVLGVAALAAYVSACIVSRATGAKTADDLLDSPRRPASAALDLDPSHEETPLAKMLADRARSAAAAELAAIPASRLIPRRPLVIAGLCLVAAALPLIVLRVKEPDATRVVAHRLFHPGDDVPPWSPLRFTVITSPMSAVYGGGLPMTVEVTGAVPVFPVELLVRRDGRDELLRLPCFRESPTRFSRTLESLTEPVSIAFACGRARSEWMPVELLLQPKVLSGTVTIIPPAYTGREAIATPLDSNEISALEGSTISLRLSSNRPLSSSPLGFIPATAPGEAPIPQEIENETLTASDITWRWTVTRPGKLVVRLKDIRGTSAATSLELVLKAIPDQPPVVDLTSPPRFLLATPHSTLHLSGRAEDDFGLAKVQLVRTLQGFRDRTRVVASTLREKGYDFDDAVELASLGVAPGQTIELFLEASDHNPSLLGQGASEISRIQIISEDDYATRIRAKTTLEQFNARYAVIAQALEKAQDSLEAMNDAALTGDPFAVEEARRKALEAHEQAVELLQKLADDFPAFAMEQRLKDLAKKAAGEAQENVAQLAQFDPTASLPEQVAGIRQMLDRLGASEPEHRQLQHDAAAVAEAGKIMEMAAKFQQIYQTQQSLTKRIAPIAKEIHEGNDQNRRLLASLAEVQEKNRAALDDFAIELKRRAESLPEPMVELRDSALHFVEALKAADPQSLMDSAAKAGRLGAANDAYVEAELARSILEGLMKNDNDPFSGACQSQSPKFSLSPPDVNSTMQQMLEGLMCQNPGMSPNEHQGGGGMGAGGNGPTGNAAPGFGMPDVSVLGPQRLMFEPASLGGSTDGHGQTGPVKPLPTTAENETLKPAEVPRVTRSAPDPESVPEPYREAVKHYFTPDN
jgi:hypothetical protein